MPLSGKQSAGLIPTHATPSIPNTHWEGAPEAGKLCARLLHHRLVTQSLPHGSSGLSCPRHHPCPSSPGAPHLTPQHWWKTGSKRKQQRNVTTAKNCLISCQSSSCTHQVTQAPTRCRLSTDQHIWLCRECSAQATRVLLHPQSTQAFPRTPLCKPGCYMENKPRAATTGKVQPGDQKGSREQGFFLSSGCSRSQLLWSSYPGHNSSAVFPAAPGNTSSRKQQCVPWNTRLQSSSEAGRQALQSRRQHMHGSCPASSLEAGTRNRVLNQLHCRQGDPVRQGLGRAAAGVYIRKALEAICHR